MIYYFPVMSTVIIIAKVIFFAVKVHFDGKNFIPAAFGAATASVAGFT